MTGLSPHPHIKAIGDGFIVADFLQVEYLTSQSQNPGLVNYTSFSKVGLGRSTEEQMNKE